MNNVYVVTQGRYSDFKVVGIFSTIELAEKLKEAIGTENDIVEYPIDEICPRIIEGYKLYCIYSMDRNGEILTISVEDWDGCKYSLEEMNGKDYGYPNGENRWVFFIWAKEEMDAVKTANECRVQLIERGLWDNEFDPFSGFVCFDYIFK